MAELIREALAADGITQAAFSRQVGVSQKHLSLVLQSKVGARSATLDYWAFVLRRRFNVSLDITCET